MNDVVYHFCIMITLNKYANGTFTSTLDPRSPEFYPAVREAIAKTIGLPSSTTFAVISLNRL